MPAFDIHSSNRVKICRLCGKNIEKNEMCIGLRKLQLPSREFDLFFHTKCFYNNIDHLSDKLARE